MVLGTFKTEFYVRHFYVRQNPVLLMTEPCQHLSLLGDWAGSQEEPLIAKSLFV